MKFNIRAFALTYGIVWGMAIFLLTWWIMAFDGATGEASFIGTIYHDYTISPQGRFIGLAWGFFDGLIGGAIFA